MEENQATPSGLVRNMGVLNLLGARGPEDFERIDRIQQVGVVLIPETLLGAFGRISLENVGAVVPVPTDTRINLLAGQTKLTGDAIASGDPDTLLFVAGQLIITTPVLSVGYRDIQVAGQILAPRGSESALSRAVSRVMGQVVYFPEGARTLIGDSSLTEEFLELLPERTSLVVMGALKIEDDVSSEMLKSKIAEIVLMGAISAPRRLLSIVNFLTPEKMGAVNGRDE